jgi:Tol biopolymer transport system component
MAFGQNLYSIGCTPCPVEPARSWDIQTMATDGSSPPESIAASEPGFIASHPSWSPDRRSITFAGVAGRIGETGADIFVTDGTSTRRLTDGNTPTWSPDGRWILFERSQTDGGQPELFRIRPDGSGEHLLGAGYASTVAFSPDGTQLAVVASRDIEHRFLSVGPFGANLADGAIVDDASDPAWSPDGERLAWSLADAQAIRIWVGSPNGSNAEPIAEGVAPSWRPIIGPGSAG